MIGKIFALIVLFFIWAAVSYPFPDWVGGIGTVILLTALFLCVCYWIMKWTYRILYALCC